MQIERIPYGVSTRGEQVDKFTIHNSSGTSFSLITYGATITSVKTPDVDGTFEEITLGFDRLDLYEGPHPYFGATVGRYANRIKNGEFELDGRLVQLDRNEGSHHLHGGSAGFSRKVWEAFPIKNEKEAGVSLTLTSEEGEMGYPGTLEVRLTVMLSEENELSLTYEAGTDAATPVNLTNHTYWNLSGECAESVYEHTAYINSSHFLEVDKETIPTGHIHAVDGGPFDFRSTKFIGQDIEEQELQQTAGYDHCFTLSEENALSIPAAEIHEPKSGRTLTLFTISPGLQFYTGNKLDGIKTRCKAVHQHDAFCLEAQEYPDSVHHKNFPDAILRPEQHYLRKTVYLFSAEKR